MSVGSDDLPSKEEVYGIPKENNKVFSDEKATDILGIGSNMVKSLKYWMLATKLAEEKNKGMCLTDFGELIYTYFIL